MEPLSKTLRLPICPSSHTSLRGKIWSRERTIQYLKDAICCTLIDRDPVKKTVKQETEGRQGYENISRCKRRRNRRRRHGKPTCPPRFWIYNPPLARTLLLCRPIYVLCLQSRPPTIEWPRSERCSVIDLTTMADARSRIRKTIRNNQTRIPVKWSASSYCTERQRKIHPKKEGIETRKLTQYRVNGSKNHAKARTKDSSILLYVSRQ